MIERLRTDASRTRVAVIGGGIIGLATAWRLAGQGCQVTVFDRSEPGTGASFAAAGMLSVAGEAEPDSDPLFELCRESRRRWPDFASELEAASGLSVGLRNEGTLLVAMTDDEARRLERLSISPRADKPLRPLTADLWRAREPGLTDRLSAVYAADEDGQVDNRAAVAALMRANPHAGVTIVPNADVLRLLVKGDRVVGLRTQAQSFEADIVVVATGVGTDSLLAGSGLERIGPAIAPVKGQMLALEMDPRAPVVRSVIRSEGIYLVPRASGRLIVGATSEPGVFDTTITSEATNYLLTGASALVPALARLTVAEQWTGLRPRSASGLPVIGSPLGGLIFALGHYRNGILLAPITADLIAGTIAGTLSAEDAILAAPFGPTRQSAGLKQPLTA